MKKIQKTDHFYLIDGSGYIFRAYYALPPLSRKSDGLPTGAVSGFCSMLHKLLEDAKSDDSKNKPTHFAVIFDSARQNFRNEIYKEYKANRSEPPEELVPQFDLIKKATRAIGLKSLEVENYEADDIIATYVKKIRSISIIVRKLFIFLLKKRGKSIFPRAFPIRSPNFVCHCTTPCLYQPIKKKK